MEWLSWNFPEVHDEAARVKQDTRVDYKSSDYATQHPFSTGKTPAKR